MKPNVKASNRQPGLLAWIHMLRVTHKVQRSEIAHLAEYNLTLPQFDVLTQLHREEGITQQTLADRLLVTKGNVCGLMERMLEQGLVERRPDPNDRRAYMLYLTARGRQLIETVLPTLGEVVTARLGGLDSAKQKQLLELLSQLDHSLD